MPIFLFQPVEFAALPPQEARPRTNSYIRTHARTPYSVKSTVESLRDLPVRSGRPIITNIRRPENLVIAFYGPSVTFSFLVSPFEEPGGGGVRRRRLTTNY